MENYTLALTIGLVIKLYALMTPPAVLSYFISHTGGKSQIAKYVIACKASLAIFVIGEIMLLFGSSIFSLFGFTIDAFRIGVGLLLFLSAINLMNDDDESPPDKDGDISVVPLAIPLGMGPAAIGAVMVLGASAASTFELVIASTSLFMASLAMAVLLCLADVVRKIIGRTGIAVMAKLTALLLSAIAAQVIFTGIKAFLPQH